MLMQLPRVIDVGNPVNYRSPVNRGLFAWWVNLPGINRSAYAHASTYNTTPAVYDICERAGGGTCTGVAGMAGVVRPSGYRSYRGVAGQQYVSTSLKRPYVSGATGMTVAFWAYPTASGQTYVFNGTNSTNIFAVIHNFQAGKWNIYEGSYASGGSMEMTCTQNAWQHVIYTRNATRVQSYLNGILINDRTHSWGALPAITAINIGQSLSNGGQAFVGFYDDMRLYNRQLTSNDAWNLFQASRTGYQRELNWLDRPFVLSAPATTFAVSGSITGDAGTISGSLEFSPPVFNLTGSITGDAGTISGALAFAPPVFALSGAITGDAGSITGSLAFAPPVFALAGAITGDAGSIAGQLEFSIPEIIVSGTITGDAGSIAGSLAVARARNVSCNFWLTN